MKRLHARILAAAVAVLVLALPAVALADSLSGGEGWKVTYDASGKLVDNYSSEAYASDVKGLQPGDDITFVITLSHENSTAGDWYMSNEVVKSLESGAAADSAYGYRLVYTGASSSASRTIYDSSVVGGTGSSGLLEATSGLEDYFFLETLSAGQTATVTLVVTLDGETEGNDYFNTLAQLKMQFAVEAQTSSSSRPVVYTGDASSDLFPFYIAMAVSGALLLVVAIVNVRRRKRESEVEGR